MRNILKKLDEMSQELENLKSMILDLGQHIPPDGSSRYNWGERPEFERPSEERQATMSTGERVWLVLQDYLKFPKGVTMELESEDTDGDGVFDLDILLPDEAEPLGTNLLFTIPINTNKIKANDKPAFTLCVIDQVKIALVENFIDLERAQRAIENWNFLDALFTGDYTDYQTGYMVADKLVDLPRVREHITFLRKYTENFDSYDREDFLGIASMQIPELKAAVMIAFVKTILKNLTTIYFTAFNKHASSNSLELIPTLAMKGGYLEVTFASHGGLGQTLNLTKHTLRNSDNQEKFLKFFHTYFLINIWDSIIERVASE